MALFITLIAIAAALLYLAGRWRYGHWKRRGIPHDPCTFPTGNFGDWPKKRQFSIIFRDTYQKFKHNDGLFAGFFFYFTKTVIVTDLELVKKILIKDFNNFENRDAFHNEVDDPLSASLFFIEGQKWRQLRHKLSPTFTSGKMKFMFPTVVKVGEELSKIYKEKLQHSNGRVLEVTDLAARFTADVIGSCAFGLDCNSLHNPSAEFVQVGRRAIIERRYGGYLDFLLFGFPKLARRLRMKQTVQDVEDFYMRVVRETINYRVENKIRRNDFMDIMIEMYKKHQDGNEQEGLSFNELAAQAFIFFLAGFETSSTTMGFALYELAQHQKIQDKLRTEVRQVLAKHNNEFTYEAMKDMHYMEMVVMETLRKFPALANLERVAIENYSTGDPKYYIEKGSVVIIATLGIHYDPDIYPEPEKFIPERFTEENIVSRPACSWLPFGDGPRNCIGSRFGLMQTMIGLAYLFKDYRFSVAPETQIPVQLLKKHFLLASESGIHLKVEKV